MPLEIMLIGDIGIRGGGEEAGASLTGGNARVALALLALERAGGVTPERLADVVWPDGLPATWDSALRMTVSRVRSFVRAALQPGAPDPIPSQGGRYRLQLPEGTALEVDVEAAERSLAAARRSLGSGDPSSAQRLAVEAADRLRGPFLPGRHGGWVDEQRDRLSDLLVAALEVASQAAAEAGDAAAALAAADEAVERAPLRESAHRARMAAHAAAGNRGEALLAYQRLRRVLAEQLGVDPDAETEAAYLQLLGPAPARPTRRPGEDVTPEGTGGRPSAGAPAPFVGREAELAVLGAAWDRAVAGARHLVVVTGEAGIGKTRLATEGARRVSAEGGLVLFGRCDQEAIVPYQPIVEALDGHVAATPPDGLPVLDDEARAELAAVLPSLEGPRATGRGAGGRARLFDAVTTLLARVAAERPVLLVLDDLQWADDDTLLLVRHLLRRSGDAPMLVVAISRDHDVVPGSVLGDVIHALDRDGWVQRLSLRGLEESDVRALLESSIASPPTDRAALARWLVAETAGNPFLVTEMLRGGPPEAEWTPGPGPSGPAPETPGAGGMFADQAIPPSVRDLVTSRLARLDADTTELLRAAAVAGSRFELDVVSTAAGLDEKARLDALDAALRSALITEETPERCRFPHDIVRRTLVAELSGARRRALHARLADALASLRSDRADAYAALLAHHTSAAASPRGDRRAVHWSRIAAAQAAERRALAEAIRLERQALTHVPGDDGGLQAEVTTDLAIALLAAGDPSGEHTLIEGATLARRHGRLDVLALAALALADRAADSPDLRPDATALVEAALDSFPAPRDEGADDQPAGDEGELLHARLLARRVALTGALPTTQPPGTRAALALRRRVECLGGPDHLDERVGLATDLAILAEATSDTASAVVAAHERAMVAAITGDDDTTQSCLRVIEEAATKRNTDAVLPALDARRQAAPASRFAAMLSAEYEAARAVMTGRFDDAEAAVDAAARARESLDEPAVATVLARRHLAVLAWMRGTAGPDGGEGGDAGDARRDTLAETALGLLGRGEQDRARLLVRELATGVHPLPGGDDLLHTLGVMALVAADVGDPTLVEAVRTLLAPHAHLTCGIGYRTFAGVAAFHLGRLAAAAGDWAEAERHMLAALRRYSALQARPWMAFTQAVLADVLEARGRPSDREWLAALRGESQWATATLGLRAP